jgi:acyl carrier protein
MNQADEIRSQVRVFVERQFPLTQRAPLGDNESLIESGIIDSMGVLDLVTFIESDFEIVISDEDVVSANFDSIATIASFIEEKLAINSKG